MKYLHPFATAAIAALVGGIPLAGCSSVGLSPLRSGQSEGEVQAQWGAPTGRHILADGGTRLEYATGPMGRETWMVDLDPAGRVRGWHQALHEPRLHAFQARAPGLALDELLRTLGRPAERQGVARVAGLPGEVWSWRYQTNECLWYQVSIGQDRRVVDAGFGIDPRCDMRDGSSKAPT